VTDLVALKEALQKLGYQYTESTASQRAMVRGYKGQTTEAEIVINMGSYDIGVVKGEHGTYEYVSDWWGVETTKGISEEEFVDTVNREYAVVRVLHAVQAQGYTIDENSVGQDGTVQLTAQKWG
jgi:hypothetical protein